MTRLWGLWGHPLHESLQLPRVTCTPGWSISISGSVGPAFTQHRPHSPLSNVFLEHCTRLVALLSQSPTLKPVPQLLSCLFTPGYYPPHSLHLDSTFPNPEAPGTLPGLRPARPAAAEAWMIYPSHRNCGTQFVCLWVTPALGFSENDVEKIQRSLCQ